MGEVYRAHDSKLNRDVALKVLPEAFALDPDRLARFKREAQVLASLNHPHIAAIYGFEDSGSTHALVLELVDGPTLADRITRGPIPFDEALPIATQIADALEAAHEQGIIHRDLKPANIKLRPDGTVKVLDFGLAKALEPPSALSPNVTNSPTITSPAMMTGLGVLLGTAAYMSPEQATGRAADKRADIWAFGVVLYEMLTGATLFAGETISHTLASVLKDTPDLSRVPLRVRPLLASCLEKDPKKRLRDIGDGWRLLDGTAGSDGPRASSRSSRAGLIAALGAAVVFAGISAWLATRPTAPARTTALTVGFDGAHALTPPPVGRSVAISPDGRRIAYVGPNNALLLRSLDQLEPSVLVSDAQVMSPFFSPDGLWVGYFDNNRDLRKVPIAGGPSTRTTALDSGLSGGATWAEDGAVVFATNNRATGLLLLLPGSSSFSVLTTPNRQANEGDHLWPEFLPGGRAVLFTILPADGTLENAQVAVCDIRTGVYRVVVPGGTDAHYLPSGHLVYSARGVLRVIAFDLEKLQATGQSTPLGTSVLTTPDGAAHFDLAADGTFVYVPGALQGQARRQLVWIGRDGAEEALGVPDRNYLYPRLSPDGSRVLLDIRDQDNDIWLFDLRRGTLTNLTHSPSLDRFPLWTPDGKSFIFTSDREGNGKSALYRQSAEGAGEVERLSDGTTAQQVADAFSPDGKQLIVDLGTSLTTLTLDGTRRMSPLLETPSAGPRAALTADGRSLAYTSNESGKNEIYVRPFPNVNGGKMQVSNGGGVEPWWSRTRSELFYFTPNGALMSAEVNGSAVNRPAVVFAPRSFFYNANGTAAATFDVSPDGHRFLMVKAIAGDQTSSPQMVVVQNWLESVKRLLPAR
jgi:serine/threonine-protein kinase